MLSAKERALLLTLKRKANLERASVHFTADQLAVLADPSNRNGPFGYSDTDVVREALRLYLECTVNPLFDILLGDDDTARAQGYESRLAALTELAK